MATRKLLPLAAAVAMTVFGSTAYGNVISLTSASQQAGLGDQVSFDVIMDFVDTTTGGSFDVFYDSTILAFESFEFDAGFLGGVADPDFAISPDNCLTDGAADGGCSVGDAELNGIGFGSFDGITGTHRIGTLTFSTLDLGVGVVLMATNDAPWGGFFSAIDASELVVLYGPGKVRVVPIPAAAWLFVGGLGLLAGFRRKA